jgi:hypothetical protein
MTEWQWSRRGCALGHRYEIAVDPPGRDGEPDVIACPVCACSRTWSWHAPPGIIVRVNGMTVRHLRLNVSQGDN